MCILLCPMYSIELGHHAQSLVLHSDKTSTGRQGLDKEARPGQGGKAWTRSPGQDKETRPQQGQSLPTRNVIKTKRARDRAQAPGPGSGPWAHLQGPSQPQTKSLETHLRWLLNSLKEKHVGENLITRGSMCGHFALGGLPRGSTGVSFFFLVFIHTI